VRPVRRQCQRAAHRSAVRELRRNRAPLAHVRRGQDLGSDARGSLAALAFGGWVLGPEKIAAGVDTRRERLPGRQRIRFRTLRPN
jgi:hypothetical protein